MAGSERGLFGLSLLVCAGTLAAAEPPRQAVPAPSAELLLYLAEFKDASGAHVDPQSLDSGADAADDAETAPSPAPTPTPRVANRRQPEAPAHAPTPKPERDRAQA